MVALFVEFLTPRAYFYLRCFFFLLKTQEQSGIIGVVHIQPKVYQIKQL